MNLRRLANRVCVHFAQLTLFSALILPVLAGAVWAQSGGIDNVPDDQRRSQQELNEAEKAAERARIRRLIDGDGDVT